MNALLNKIHSLQTIGIKVSETLNEGEYLVITSFNHISGFYMQVEDRNIELTLKDEHTNCLSSYDMDIVCGDDPGFAMFIDSPKSWDCKSEINYNADRLIITWTKSEEE